VALNASDDFDRADETPFSIAGNWRQGGHDSNSWLSSNTIITDDSVDSIRSYYWNTTPSTNDQTSSIDNTTLSTTPDAGVTARMDTTAQTWYQARGDGTTGAIIGKLVGGVFTALAIDGATAGANVEIRVTGSGTTTIEAYKGATQQTSITDSSIASGYVGFVQYNGSSVLDNWVGGDYPLTLVSAVSLLMMGVG